VQLIVLFSLQGQMAIEIDETTLVITVILAIVIGIVCGQYLTKKEKVKVDAPQEPPKAPKEVVSVTPKMRLKKRVKVESESSGDLTASAGIATTTGVLTPAGGRSDSDKINIARQLSNDVSGPAQLRPIIDNATSLLYDIVGMKGSGTSDYGKRPWELVRTGPSSHFWLSSSKDDGVLLRGTSLAASDAKDVYYWLMKQNECIGIESIAISSDLLYHTEDRKTSVHRLRCKSGSITSWVRDFVIINNISEKPDGTVVIVSQTLSDEYIQLIKKQQNNSIIDASSTTSTTKLSGSSRSVRGILYCSGYILRPLKAGEGTGCEISYGCHLDFKGSKSLNSGKMDALMCHMQSTMDKLQFGQISTADLNARASSMDNLDAAMGSPTTLKKTLTSQSAGNSTRNSESSNGVCDRNAAGGEVGRLNITQQDLDIDEEQQEELMKAAKGAMQTLRQLNDSADKLAGAQNKPNKPSGAGFSNNSAWDTFFESDGITVSECNNGIDPVGPIQAQCTINASPSVVRKLLRDNPHAIDSLLEGRTILAALDTPGSAYTERSERHITYVQWLAYASIWPVGARDFLVVTSEDYFDVVNNTGFVIASTSVDHICEEEEVLEDGGRPSVACKLTTDKYSRSCLRLAGYVGKMNANGGTDLKIFVDMELVSYIPAWLLQVLAQYGLSEMMKRIRIATSGAAIISSATKPVGEGGNGTRTAIATAVDKSAADAVLSAPYQIERVLTHIHNKEERIRKYVTTNKLADGALPEEFKGSVAGGAAASAVPAGASSPGRGQAALAASPKLTGGKSAIPALSADKHRSHSPGGDVPATPAPAEEHAEEHLSPLHKLSFKVAKEAIPIFKCYVGLESRDDLKFEFVEKLNKSGISVCISPVANSQWVAMNAKTTIQNCTKAQLLKLLSDDTRIGEYDDMFDGHSVRDLTSPYLILPYLTLPVLLLFSHAVIIACRCAIGQDSDE
jgi:hypothetical protein